MNHPEKNKAYRVIGLHSWLHAATKQPIGSRRAKNIAKHLVCSSDLDVLKVVDAFIK